MVGFYDVIIRFHCMFGTHRHAIKKYPFLLVAFLVSFALFGWSIAWYFQKVGIPWLGGIPIENRLYCSLGVEGLALSLWAKINEVRNNLSILRCQAFLGAKEVRIYELKRMWLEREVGLPRTEYLMVARSIDEAENLLNRHRSKLSLGKSDVARYVFSNESKNRVLAMLMGAVAVFTALSISNGASIETVLTELSGIGAWSYVKYVVAISIVIFFFGILLRQVFMASAVIFEVTFDGRNSRRLASNFINELLAHYSFVNGNSHEKEVTYKNISKFSRTSEKRLKRSARSYL